MTSRTTSKGGKTGKGDTHKGNKHDKSDSAKSSGDNKQNTSDHIRSKTDDPGIKEKVKQVMDMTRRSEEEVCYALHECDNDTERAVNMLFENMVEGEWETSCKKKKNRQISTSKAEPDEAAVTESWSDEPIQIAEKEKIRPKGNGGPPPRLHGRHNDNRGWRGRENKENSRNNFDDGGQDRRERRGVGGRPGGHMRGVSGSRGRGGGRAGSRYPPRTNRNNFSNTRTTSIETWDNSATWETTTITNSLHTNYNAGGEESWDEFPSADDWSTEEYTGSLADTKVFTPSMTIPPAQIEPISDPNFCVPPPVMMEAVMPTSIAGTLNAAQTQYLNQLTKQSNENLKTQQYISNHPSQPYGNPTSQPYNPGQTYINSGSQQYNTMQQYANSPVSNPYTNNSYAVVNSGYSNIPESHTSTQHQPARTKTQRARVPPPSKIPASAVEMPGDINSSIDYLDLQFGAMDFTSDGGTFETPTDIKYSPTNDSLNSNQIPNSNVDLVQVNSNPSLDATKPNTQSSITSVLSQNLPNADNIPQATEHLSGMYNATSRSTAANTTPTPAMEISKQTEPHPYTQPSTYNSYQPKTSTYQGQNFSSSTYNAAQTTTSNYANNNASTYTPNTANTYQNSYPSSVSSYQTNTNVSAFPTISQANSYPPTNQYQQTTQSVYGTNAGLNSNSNYAGSASQYSSYNTNSSKIVKESSYDNSTSVSSSTAAGSVSTSTISQATSSGTKPTTSLAKNSNNVISNIPPAGVTPVMSTQYIMGQVPYFQQPIYSYEDVQLLQQRIPHMTAGYYDMGYQTPTTLATVRDATLANVAYSISDGRFTRGDNTSPVPSTLSQQTSTLTQAHQAQPLLAAQTGATPFFYAPYNAIQPTYQFGAVYPVTDRGIALQQLPTVTNAHGSTNSQYPKPTTYGSAYGSGYDPLTQSQDYNKGSYVGNTQVQNKGSGANSSTGGATGNDLTAMYGKSHTALGKVNSYEKQGFHSGTPPPFTGALHGNQSTGLAPSGTNYGAQMFIPTMPPHQQHHSTPLIHQPLHQESGNSTGPRSQVSTQGKSGGKQGYPTSYWNQA